MNLVQVHIFGASLGGYLGQKFAEYTASSPRVASLVLCNSFSDTSIFKGHDSTAVYWMLPALVLKRMLMSNFEPEPAKDPDMVRAVDFMVEKVCI